MRLSNLLACVALAGLGAGFPLLGGTALADVHANRADVMSVEDVKPGMKGYGLTVFEGTEPERFDVEVIGVLKNFRPKQELILVKTTHPRLEVAKVVAGMSGSPVYINDKMIGAYAYGWTFGAEPIAGVTPIRNMLDDMERPIPKLIDGWPIFGAPGKSSKPVAQASGTDAGVRTSLANRYAGDIANYDLKLHAEQLQERYNQTWAAPSSPVRPVATPLLVGGLSGSSIEVLSGLFTPVGLEPLQAGGDGGVEAGAPARYVDGGAISVQLMRGDVVASGLGTVTRVEGDLLVAFGHPMSNTGVTAMPTAVSKVLWFLASSFRSFKLGMPIRPVGALVNDRQASIVVSHKAQAPVIPVSVDIHGVPGAPSTKWNVELAHEKFMAPSLLAVALGNSVETTGSEKQDVSWNATTKISIRGYGELELEDYGVSVGGTPSPAEFIRSNAVRAFGTLLNNPWEPLFVESVKTKIEMRYAREMLRLRGAELLEAEVDAGKSARVRLTLVPFNGPAQTQVVSIPMPVHLAGERVTIQISPGYNVDHEKASPDSVAQLVESFENPTFPPKTAVFSYAVGDGVVFNGHTAQNLPPGALDSMRPASATIAPESFRSYVHQTVTLPEFMIGEDRVTVQVRPVRR